MSYTLFAQRRMTFVALAVFAVFNYFFPSEYAWWTWLILAMPVGHPTVESVHHDALLTNISVGYTNPGYIADQVFPIVNVRKQTDVIPKYDKSHFFRHAAEIRAPGAPSLRGGFKVTHTDLYHCPRFSYGFEIPDELRDNADEPFNMDRDGTRFVTEKGYLCREGAFATDYFATSKGWTDLVGGTNFFQWSDYAASSPLTDMETWKDNVEAIIGQEPKTLVLGKQAWVPTKWHPDLIDTVKYTQRGVMTTELMASLFEVDRILIGRAIRVTSAEGVAEGSATYARIFGKSGLLLYVPAGPSLMTPAAGYTFVWARVPNALQYIKRIRNEEREIDIIEMNSYFDQALIVGNAGTFLSGLVA